MRSLEAGVLPRREPCSDRSTDVQLRRRADPIASNTNGADRSRNLASALATAASPATGATDEGRDGQPGRLVPQVWHTPESIHERLLRRLAAFKQLPASP